MLTVLPLGGPPDAAPPLGLGLEGSVEGPAWCTGPVLGLPPPTAPTATAEPAELVVPEAAATAFATSGFKVLPPVPIALLCHI